MSQNLNKAINKVKNIAESQLTIYDEIAVGDKQLWLTSEELEELLNSKITGISLQGLKLRTRSKTVKTEICNALGYSIPKSFKKTQPRFTGQKFDIYTQKSNNLQVWNEDLDSSRRYVLVRVDKNDIITKIKVVSGSDLAPLDTTGKLTQKYQASLKNVTDTHQLVSEEDTPYIAKLCGDEKTNLEDTSPIALPIEGKILPISTIYEKLKLIVGKTFPDPGSDQERNRGAGLHKLVCEALGFYSCQDNGQFPDIRNQLLEVKLQTSPTIDLGLVSPDSENALDMEKINDISVRHCDVRYAIFSAVIEDETVKVTNLILTNGRDFFGRFPKFEGKGLNKKIQIPLPKNYFD